MPEYKVINNEKQMRFEIHEGEETGFLEYKFYGNTIAFIHTEVPDSLEGKGVGSALAKFAFEYARENNKSVKVYCSFVSTYLKKHPEVAKQLDQEFHM